MFMIYDDKAFMRANAHMHWHAHDFPINLPSVVLHIFLITTFSAWKH